jgi:glycosyltransferase involved in cell wall biosynthesis
LRQNTAHPFFLTVVDNGSDTAMQEELRKLEAGGVIDQLFLHKRNMGVSVAANTGWQASLCPYYIKMDNDILLLKADWLDSMLALCEEEDFSAVAFKLCAWHGSRASISPLGKRYEATEALGGGCVLIPRGTHETLGFWNEDYLYGWEDLEYGNRIRLAQGRMAYLPPDGRVEHLGADDPVRRSAYQNSKNCMAGTLAGPESLFLLNTAMFEMNLRPLRVIRKFLPSLEDDGFVSYSANPEYASILTRQTLFRERFVSGYTEDGLRIKPQQPTKK